MVKHHGSLCHDSACSNWLSKLCSRILGTNDVRSFLVWKPVGRLSLTVLSEHPNGMSWGLDMS